MLLKTESLCKTYHQSRTVKAVDMAEVMLDAGETVGLFGDSGSGKTTLGMMVAGLLSPTSGPIFFEGQPLRMPYRGQIRRRIQILFQHPETSFNPELILLRSMTEPYRIYDLPYSYEILLENISRFGLHEEHLYRQPSQLSGGELQRAALARILTIQPDLVVLDEPTSMLDVITQAQIMQMLRYYQQQHHTAYLLISHSKAICEAVCTRIYHVENGRFTLPDPSGP